MKSIYTLALLIFSFSAFSETDIFVSPKVPIRCAVHDGVRANWIYELEKLNETEKEASFRFKTKHGRCLEGKPDVYPLDAAWAAVGMFQDSIQLPWRRNLYVAEIVAVTDSVIEVTLTFDKERLFKKRNERSFTMGLYPRGYVHGFNYEWNVDVNFYPETGTSVAIQ